MKKVARELQAVSSKLKELINFQFVEVDAKQSDFVNSICSEIDDLADRIRRNEGLRFEIERVSEDDSTSVKIRMTDHEALKAIREEIAEKLGKMSKKKKLEIKVSH